MPVTTPLIYHNITYLIYSIQFNSEKGLSGGRTELTQTTEVKVNAAMEQAQMNIFQVMWNVTELDIRSTLLHVCTRVTHDHSVDKDTCKLRLLGIKVVGEVFLECGGTAAAGLEDIKVSVGVGYI